MKVKRKDIVTKKIFNREELIRISIQKNGETSVDKKYNKGGRGIYIHSSSIKIGLDKKILEKNIKRFNGNLDKTLEKLLREVKNG